jgi:hypothetical protein
LRFLYLVYLTPGAAAHRTYIPSLILLAVLAIFGAGLAALAIIAELQRGNRRLVEEILYQVRRQAAERSSSVPASSQNEHPAEKARAAIQDNARVH